MGGEIIILRRMQQQCRWMLVPLCSVTKPKTERGSKLMDVEGGLAAELSDPTSRQMTLKTTRRIHNSRPHGDSRRGDADATRSWRQKVRPLFLTA